MSGHVKGALIIGGAIIVATALWIYFSPYQTCLRTPELYEALEHHDDAYAFDRRSVPEIVCLSIVAGRDSVNWYVPR